jgi:hypothetical protein
MPLYRIERTMEPVSEAELEAAALRTQSCLSKFPDLKWHRSFFDPVGWHTTCYYEADDPERIREHARMAAISCDSITEVIEVTPERFG